MKVQIDDIIPIFKKIFENDHILITEETKAADIAEWDSLNNIYLVVEIEKKFNVKFTVIQIQSWECVKDILRDLNEAI